MPTLPTTLPRGLPARRQRVPLPPVAGLPAAVAVGAAAVSELVPWPAAQHVLAGLLVGWALLGGRVAAVAAGERRGLGAVAARGRELTTVLFTDIVGSTERAAEVGDDSWRDLLDRHDTLVRAELRRHGGREVTATGDGFLATFDTPGRAVRSGLAVASAVRDLGLEVRAGVHTSEVERRGADVAGLGVHVGARVAALAGPGEVLVSRTVADLTAGAGLELLPRGEHRLRGVPGTWALFAASGGLPEQVPLPAPRVVVSS